VIGVFLLAAMVLLVIYFGHPDDKNEALFPKLVVVLGLWLSFSSILILPYDISNSRGSGGGVRVDILWQVIYMSMAVFLSTILPFAFFFYESDVDPNADTACCDGQFCSALKYTGAFFFVFFTLLFIACR
jgi:LMBR1 domain-containing protein 1